MHQQGSGLNFDVNVSRVVSVIATLMIVVVIYQISGGGANSKWNKMIVFMSMCGVMPFIFVLKHPSMKEILKKLTKDLSSVFRSIDSG